MKEKNIEFRSFTGDAPVIESREDGQESRRIVGYAAKFDKWSLPIGGWFKEKISRGAFDDVLKGDVVAVFNHDKNYILARNGSTLNLSVDDVGLRYEFEAPNNTAGNDLLESVSRGDIKGSSFRFIANKITWETAPKGDEVEELRTIEKVETLIDVGPVTFPAYPDTEVAKRSRDAFYKERESDDWKHSYEKRSRDLHILNLK